MEKGNVGMIHKECADKRKNAWQEANAGITINKRDFVKIAFSDGKKTEYMWVQVKEILSSYHFRGTLANDPVAVKNIKCGDKVDFKFEDIEEYIAQADF